MKIYLGPGGSPVGSSLKGVEYVHDNGLTAMEVEFVYGVKMTNKTAKEVGAKAKELGVKLSVHAPYFVNLASEDATKRVASKQRILMSAERAHHLGAEYVVFHPGYYMKSDKTKTYEVIKKAILDMQKHVKAKNWNVKLAPETMGKINVFGSLPEVLRLVKETKCSMCVDWAHMLARNQGVIDYDEIMRDMKKSKLKHFHCHFSGIEYTDKGERRHKITEDKQIKELVAALARNKISCTLINESPNPIGDSLKTKKALKTKIKSF